MATNDEINRTDTTIGAIVRYVVGYIAIFFIGWFGHAWFYGSQPAPYVPPAPQPSPYYPQPDNDIWYMPPTAALRQLPRDPADGYDRRGQTWRWEINQRAEYRFHRVQGDAGELGSAPKNISQASPSDKSEKPAKSK